MEDTPLLIPPTTEPERAEFLRLLSELLPYCRLNECDEGCVIIEQGSSAEVCFLLLWGVVRIDQFDPRPDGTPDSSRKPALLDYGEPGDLLGEGCLLGESYHTTRVTAVETCTLLNLTPALPRELNHFQRFISLAPVDIWQRMALGLTTAMRRRAEASQVFQLPNAPARISRRLVQLQHRFPGSGRGSISIQLSAFDLSRQLAVDERTVERELAKLRGDNERKTRVIELLDDRIAIADQRELVSYGVTRGRSLFLGYGDKCR